MSCISYRGCIQKKISTDKFILLKAVSKVKVVYFNWVWCIPIISVFKAEAGAALSLRVSEVKPKLLTEIAFQKQPLAYFNNEAFIICNEGCQSCKIYM